MSEFCITDHKGIRLTFKNGYAISVQWGWGNYCDHHMEMDYDKARNSRFWKSDTAEIAIIKPDGNFMQPKSWGDTVKGWCSVDEVAKWIAYTRRQK